MITREFSFNGALIKIGAANRKRDAFDSALMLRKLSTLYKDVIVDDKAADALVQSSVNEMLASGNRDGLELLIAAKMFANPLLESGFTVMGEIKRFCTLAVRVIELHADGVSDLFQGKARQWLQPSDPVQVIDAVFQFYLDNADLFDEIEKQIGVMDKPNGVEGAAPEQLTEAERTDPLLSPIALNGSNAS